ncbi:MarC family protein [soil metagenome]
MIFEPTPAQDHRTHISRRTVEVLDTPPSFTPRSTAIDRTTKMWTYELKALTTLFVIIDPIGLIAIFLATTSDLDASQKRAVAIRATVAAAAILIGAALFGTRLLTVLGITLPAFRIAGGLLLFWIGFEMIFEKRTERRLDTAVRTIDDSELTGLAIFPLAIPMISGPGAISAVIVTASRAPSDASFVALLVVIVALLVVTLGCFLLSHRLGRLLGTSGQLVIARLLGLLLTALAVQIVADGVREM